MSKKMQLRNIANRAAAIARRDRILARQREASALQTMLWKLKIDGVIPLDFDPNPPAKGGE